MYFFSFSINIFSLLAMILAIGLVVDDAIVMLENIFRHSHELGKTAMQAAFDASKEIGFAIIAMTITLASVFLPIGFIEGFLGKLFIEFAWTLAFCVLISGFVALTLTPMMSSRMITSRETPKPKILQKFDYYFFKLQTIYIHYLELTLQNKKKFSIVSATSIIILILNFVCINKAFVPEEDEGFLQVIFNGPEGSSTAESEKTVIKAEEIVSKNKDIHGFFEVIGWDGGKNAFAFVPLKNWSKRSNSQEQIKNKLNEQFSAIPGMSIFAMSPRSLGGSGSEKMIEFHLQTLLEYNEIDQISQAFINKMQQNTIFQNVTRDYKASTPTLDIIVKREKAYRYAVNLDTIGKTIQYLISGRQVGDFRMENDIYDVLLRYDESQRTNPIDLKKILIKTDNNLMLPLEVVANIIPKITVKQYNHYNNSRAINISSDLAPNKNLTEAINAIEKIAKKLIDINNTKIQYLGEIKRMTESNSGTLVTFLFALVFIYLVLSAQFESFGDSLLNFDGCTLFNNWRCTSFINMYSNIGLITLIGLITKNSIMLVEFTNQLRKEGLAIKEAMIESAKLRLRNSIGFVIVGGMILGTIFTIFVIPVLYHSFKKEIASK